MRQKEKSSELLKVLGVGFGVAILVGNAIGVGILKMPGTIAGYLNSEGLIILLWFFGGFLSLIGAVIYAEASVAYPFEGGPFAIAEKVFGRQAGFTIGFCDWVLNAAGNAYLSIAGAEYFITLTGLSVSAALVSSIIVIILAAVQWFGMKTSSTIQKLLSLLKAMGLLFLVGAFFIHGRETNATNIVAHHAALSPVSFFAAIILSFRAIILTYQGWNAPIYFTEENKNARQSLPKSLIYGVLCLAAIYILVNISLFYMLPVSAIANSPLAVADGAHIIFGNGGRIIVTVISIVIVVSSLYAGLLYTPRIIFGAAKSGLFFPFASGLNRFNIPGVALIATTILMVLFTATGTFEFAAGVSVFLYVFVDTSVYLSALYSRWRNKTEHFYKTPAFPVLHLFMIVINVALLISVFKEDRNSSIYAVMVIILTVPLYIIFRKAVRA